MAPIYTANTLRKVASDSRLAELNRITEKYVPQVLDRVNEANFSAANNGRNSSVSNINLLVIGLTTEESQNYLRIGLKTELESLGFKVDTLITANGMMTITCKW